jgi:hypothetical protein
VIPPAIANDLLELRGAVLILLFKTQGEKIWQSSKMSED